VAPDYYFDWFEISYRRSFRLRRTIYYSR
jgi:hypothetical protein